MDQMTGLKCGINGSSNGERLCDSCPKGQYVHTVCDSTRRTQCLACPHESYTADSNCLPKCLPCRFCDSKSHMRVLKECTASSNRECVCVTGFYCEDDGCEHCLPVHRCPPGSGVAKLATEKHNTQCVLCQTGTYNNVTDAITSCKPHTSCQDLGRAMERAGTVTSDAVCGDFISRCEWIVPTSIMAGLVVTLFIIIIIIFIYWRARHHRSLSDSSSSHCHLVNPPRPAFTSAHFITECNSQNPESWKDSITEQHIRALIQVNDCGPPCELETDGVTKTMTEKDEFCQSDHSNGFVGNNMRPIRYPSEPQEDEWTGT
ncbi:hypothetical protein UPYG_G00152930 [Umbra pygmaea]|uniref:TNFR-Cys domain-containing protein n=1 Tax=Umbra pygmaea TaxID=75934 RepID=A0ABD0XK11_UMBPY